MALSLFSFFFPKVFVSRKLFNTLIIHFIKKSAKEMKKIQLTSMFSCVAKHSMIDVAHWSEYISFKPCHCISCWIPSMTYLEVISDEWFTMNHNGCEIYTHASVLNYCLAYHQLMFVYVYLISDGVKLDFSAWKAIINFMKQIDV